MTTILRRAVCGARLAWAVPALFVLMTALAGTLRAQTSESLPPKPAGYFTDQAGLVDGATAAALEQKLEQFERDTSNQIVVAIYPTLPADADVAQYSTDTYNAWKVGQKGLDNGAALFVFAKDRKLFICTGRGLEGALPDATCAEIIRNVITPRFRQSDYAGGIQAGVDAMIAASKGEYKGTGQTVAEREQAAPEQSAPPAVVIIFIIIIVLLSIWGRSSGFIAPMIYTGGGWGGGGWGGGGGGFGGGFSGGGGSSAGGGAGGSW